MVATDGETGKGIGYARSFDVIYGIRVLSAQMWEVSLLAVRRNGAPSRKG